MALRRVWCSLRVGDSHRLQDGFLDVWLGTGIIGVALIGLLTLQTLRNAVYSFRVESNSSYVRWAIVVIVCTLAYNIGESSIGLINMSWFLFLIASIGLKQLAAS